MWPQAVCQSGGCPRGRRKDLGQRRGHRSLAGAGSLDEDGYSHVQLFNVKSYCSRFCVLVQYEMMHHDALSGTSSIHFLLFSNSGEGRTFGMPGLAAPETVVRIALTAACKRLGIYGRLLKCYICWIMLACHQIPGLKSCLSLDRRSLNVWLPLVGGVSRADTSTKVSPASTHRCSSPANARTCNRSTLKFQHPCRGYKALAAGIPAS